MPQMGESVAEGTIVRWLKKVGDAVERDEPLFEISTDKVDAEIPSPAAGIISEWKVKEGETVPINTVVVAVIDETGAKPAASAAKPSKAAATRRTRHTPAPVASPPRQALRGHPSPCSAPQGDGDTSERFGPYSPVAPNAHLRPCRTQSPPCTCCIRLRAAATNRRFGETGSSPTAPVSRTMFGCRGARAAVVAVVRRSRASITSMCATLRAAARRPRDEERHPGVHRAAHLSHLTHLVALRTCVPLRAESRAERPGSILPSTSARP